MSLGSATGTSAPFIDGRGRVIEVLRREFGAAKACGVEHPMTPMQVRMARAALDLTCEDLSKAAGLSSEDIERLERGGQEGAASAKLRATFEGAGIHFLDADGVRLDERQRYAGTIPIEEMNSANDE